MRKGSALLCLTGLICVLSFFFAVSAADTCNHSYTRLTYLAPTCTDAGKEILVCTNCREKIERTIPAPGHDFSLNWTVDREPTCDQAGQRSRHCSRCSAVTSIVSIEKLNHSFTTQIIAPTCTQMGYRLRKCSLCGQEMTDQYTDALGHTPGLWVVQKEATCSEQGVRSISCTVCGAVIEQKLINKTEHNYVQTVVAPTCTAAGYTLRTCRVCGAQTKTDSVKALGHNYIDTVVAPTCEEKGYTLHTCTRCGAQTKTNTVKALGHSYPQHGTVTKQPTCTEAGEETVCCRTCGTEKTQKLAALGHDYDTAWTTDKAATCTAQGEQSHHCKRCDKRKDVTATPRTDHTPVADTAAAPTCEQAGKTGGTHCKVCGKALTAATSTPALGHDFRDGDVLTAATCTEKGSVQRVCARCGKTETKTTPALGHDFGTAWTIDKEATCTAQGEQSHHCKRCGKRADVTAIARTAHLDVTDPVVEPTCTQKGKTAGAHCSVCGKVLIEQTDIPATGHSFQRISTSTEPTCTEPGRAMMACTVCGATQEQELPALGHSYDTAWTVDKEATCTAQGEQSHRCIRCGKRTDVTAIGRKEHTVVYEGVVEPTCTEKGRADRAWCSVCGKELADKTVIPALGHTEKTTVEPATTKKNGSAVTACTVCGETLATREIARIKSAALSEKKIAFNGKKKTPTVTVKDSAGKTLKAADCYTVKYAAGRKQVGKYTVTITFCGDYAGTLTRTFSIVPGKVTGLAYTSAQNSISLTWKAVSGATGYKVYLYNTGTKHYTLLKTTKKTRFAMGNLLPGTTYVLCVRAYAKFGETVLTGALSVKKTAATKPLTPELTAKVKNGKAVLAWQRCGDCVYEVYAADKKNGKFTLLGTTKKTSFSAGSFPAGSGKCFKVKALVRQKTTDLAVSRSEILTLRF